jgi:DNA replication protein DnaC
VDQQWNWHENQALGQRLKKAKVRTILDRLVHNAHGIELRGDSMRKNRGKQNS